MRALYPASEPYAVHRIRLPKSHELYVEECGNPDGVPVIFLHGGPGSGCSPDHRRYLDPAYYRSILFDQRGCGRSLPLGETQGNRTADLVADMEVIRRYLEIERWMLFGGSWGATLALVYAQAHPGRLLGMLLRGVFLARDADLKWFFQDLGRLLPQAWRELSQGMHFDDWQDLIVRYHEHVHGADTEQALRAARAWSDWGGQVVNWYRAEAPPGAEAEAETEADKARLLAKVRIETHYAYHRYFIGADEILQRVASLPAIPISIVHGRRDLACTLEAAWLLHRAIPDSRLVVVNEAGHLMSEPAMAAALVEEADRMRGLL